ncbi:RsmE family RNA methyltransferase [soil metagenome]
MDYIYDAEITALSGTIVPRREAQRHLYALRIRIGEQVGLLNGVGARYICTAIRIEDERMELRIDSCDVDAAPDHPIVVCVGMMDNRDRFEFALEKSVELGATHFVPLHCEYSQRPVVNHERLITKARAALTQCGRTWMPTVLPQMGVSGLSALIPATASVVVGDANGVAPTSIQGEVWVLVGPEGGFSEHENELIQQLPSLHPWRISAQRLRTETAAIALLTCVIAR